MTEDERDLLEVITRKQQVAAFRKSRAKALLACDEGEHGPALKDEDAAHAGGMSTNSLERLRKRVCEVGVEGALKRRKRMTPPVEPKVTGEVQAHIVRIACSEPPEGAARWTLELIAGEVVSLEVLPSISKESVRQVLKKTS